MSPGGVQRSRHVPEAFSPLYVRKESSVPSYLLDTLAHIIQSVHRSALTERRLGWRLRHTDSGFMLFAAPPEGTDARNGQPLPSPDIHSQQDGLTTDGACLTAGEEMRRCAESDMLDTSRCAFPAWTQEKWAVTFSITAMCHNKHSCNPLQARRCHYWVFTRHTGDGWCVVEDLVI